MRSLVLFSFLLVGCAAPPAPEANGFDTQLYFDGVPAGAQTLVGSSATIRVKRIEQRTDQCTTNACDPISEMPITLLSATCDDVCTVTPVPSSDGDQSVVLAAVADRAGTTTLRVRVRSLLDGAEWEDGYPLSFRNHTLADLESPIVVPNVVGKKEK